MFTPNPTFERAGHVSRMIVAEPHEVATKRRRRWMPALGAGPGAGRHGPRCQRMHPGGEADHAGRSSTASSTDKDGGKFARQAGGVVHRPGPDDARAAWQAGPVDSIWKTKGRQFIVTLKGQGAGRQERIDINGFNDIYHVDDPAAAATRRTPRPSASLPRRSVTRPPISTRCDPARAVAAMARQVVAGNQAEQQQQGLGRWIDLSDNLVVTGWAVLVAQSPLPAAVRIIHHPTAAGLCLTGALWVFIAVWRNTAHQVRSGSPIW